MEYDSLLDKGELIIYSTSDGSILTEVRLENETIWMTEQQIATVFERDRTVKAGISKTSSRQANWKKQAMCKKRTLLIRTNRLPFIIWI